jgi:DNA-binding transcriptional regulator LsrR (DeoR family)
MFGLQDVLIASYHPDEHKRRLSVAQTAAGYLERNLTEGAKVAVGLGRNASEVSNCFYPSRHLKYTFVSAMGGSPQMGNTINPNEICSRFALRTGGQAMHLYAPTYVESKQLRDVLLSQEAVKATIDLARQSDMAVMGIGTADEASILVQSGCQPLEEVRRLSAIGAVGELVGNYFDLDGNPVYSDLDNKVINLSLEELAAIPNVIAVACEIDKSYALLGALRTKVINTLVVDCQLAVNMLKLAGVNDLEEEHSLLGI